MIESGIDYVKQYNFEFEAYLLSKLRKIIHKSLTSSVETHIQVLQHPIPHYLLSKWKDKYIDTLGKKHTFTSTLNYLNIVLPQQSTTIVT